MYVDTLERKPMKIEYEQKMHTKSCTVSPVFRLHLLIHLLIWMWITVYLSVVFVVVIVGLVDIDLWCQANLLICSSSTQFLRIAHSTYVQTYLKYPVGFLPTLSRGDRSLKFHPRGGGGGLWCWWSRWPSNTGLAQVIHLDLSHSLTHQLSLSM